MGCTTCELREKDVINMCDGKKLGIVTELEIDVSCGRVCAIIVVPDTIGGILKSKNQVIVPWDKIMKIGKDTILVEAPPQAPKCDSCESDMKCRKGHKWWKF